MPSKLEQFLSLVPVENFNARYQNDIDDNSYFGFPIEPIIKAEQNLVAHSVASVGYLSMEYGLSSDTYNALSSKNKQAPKNLSGSHHAFSNLRAIDYYVSIKSDQIMDLPIYSGGLGVLAGDTLKSAADVGLSMGAVGILWNKGYLSKIFGLKTGRSPRKTTGNRMHTPALCPCPNALIFPSKKKSSNCACGNILFIAATKNPAFL